MKCPSGVNIPQNFATVNNIAMDRGMHRWNTRRLYRKLATDPSKLNKEKTNGNASLCTDCKACVKKCPQGINIPEELKIVDLIMNKGKSIKEVYQISSKEHETVAAPHLF
jgi:predicted aldo/keto reductase-like oxidoreductase